MEKKSKSLPQVGDMVRYYSVLPPAGSSHRTDYIVDEVYPNGIPSCREPMVKLREKAGLVLASHCFVMEWVLS